MARRNQQPEFAVIGLGRFGSSLALTLVERGYTVLGIDRDRDLVQQFADELTQTVALDATDEDALRAIDIAAFDTVVVGIGADFESALMTTVGLKSLGVRRVVCKALSERQKNILLKVGADRVVLPEHEAGQRLAYSLTMPLLLDHLALDANHTITEFRAPAGSIGRTLRQADLLGKFAVTLLAIKRGEELLISPPADFVLQENDLLVVIGADANLARLAELS
jgi:trk system potassium uptake protein